MVSSGRGRLFRRKDGKYLIYLPKDFADDSMFPFPLKGTDSVFVEVYFNMVEDEGAIRVGKKLIVEPWEEPDQSNACNQAGEG